MQLLNVALPKGRLGEKVYRLLAQAGCPCPSLLEESRRLIFEMSTSSPTWDWGAAGCA